MNGVVVGDDRCVHACHHNAPLFSGEWHYQSSRQTWHCVGGGRDDATASGRDNATASVCAQRAACVQGAVAAAAALLIDTV